MIVGKRPNDDGAARAPSFTRSAVQTYGTNVSTAFISLANVLVVARALGAEGRGHVAFLTAIAWLVANLATIGLQEANANFAARDPASRRALATNSVILSLLLGSAAIAIVAGLVAVVPAVAGESDRTLLWATLAFIPLILLQACLRFLVQADYAFTVTNVVYLLPAVLNVAVNGLFAALGIISVGSAVGVWLAGQAVATLVLAWYVTARLAGFGAPDLALARRSVGFGIKAHVGRIMQLGNYRLDQWLLGAIAGPRELGLYSVAVAWAEALWFLPTALSAVQRPDLVRARTRAQAARLAATVFRAAIWVTAATALAMIVAAPFLTVVVFGEEFRGSIDDLRVLVAGAFGMVALKLFGNALVAQSRPVLQSVAIGAGFLFTVALDILLIPPYGGLGAALASTLAYTAAGLVVGAIFVKALDARAADLLPRPGDLTWLARKLRDRRRRATIPPGQEQPTAAP